MSQGDQTIANQAGAAFRADLNAELQALVSQSSGASAPSTTYAYQWWADTTNGRLKIRNAANSAWLSVMSLTGATGLFAQIAPDTGDAFLNAPTGQGAVLGINGVYQFLATTAAFYPNTDNNKDLGSITNRYQKLWVAPSGININITKRKTADESVTSSTTLQDDDHLTIPIGANEEWVADFSLNVGSALLNTGIKLAVTVPSGATMSLFSGCFGASQAGAALQTTTGGAALDYTTAAMTPTNRGTFLLRLWVLNGATPGNCNLQFAQSTSSGTAVTILKGSDVKAIRVA